MKFDLLLSASTYHSVESALRFLHSVDHISGQHCTCIVGPERNEMEAIRKGLEPTRTKIVVLHARINSLYLGRAMGFLWALDGGHEARYQVSCDDDIEFTENSGEILVLLDDMAPDASLMSLRSNVRCHTRRPREDGHVPFINADFMATTWGVALSCGLPDTVTDFPVTYFTELEYMQRLRVLTGRPHIKAAEKPYYYHHFRTEPERMDARTWGCSPAMEAGYNLWRRKYETEPRDGQGVSMPRLAELCPESKMRQHLMFGGLWTDWEAICARYRDQYEVIDG